MAKKILTLNQDSQEIKKVMDAITATTEDTSIASGLNIMFYDKRDGYNRLFKTEEEFNIWKEANAYITKGEPTERPDLVRAKIKGETPRTIVFGTSLDGTGNITIGSDTIIMLNSQKTAYLNMYCAVLENATNRYTWESYTATFTITNTSTGNVLSFTQYYSNSTGKLNVQSLREFLMDGENIINISIKTNGSATEGSVYLTYRVLNLTVINCYVNNHILLKDGFQTALLNIKLQSSGYKKIIYIHLDGDENPALSIENSESEIDQQFNIIFPNNISYGLHTIQVYIAMQYSENDILYTDTYYFEVAKVPNVTYTDDRNIMVGLQLPYANSHNQGQTFIFPYRFADDKLVHPTISIKQYEKYTFSWAYYSLYAGESSADVTWALKQGNQVVTVGVFKAQNSVKPLDISVTPTIYGNYSLVASILQNETETILGEYNVIIARNEEIAEDTDRMILKLSALGRSNVGADKDKWEYIYDPSHSYSTNFSNVNWTITNGWGKNALNLLNGSTAVINYKVFNTETNIYSPTNDGLTFEIDFKVTNALSDLAQVIYVGNPNNYINITATTATIHLEGVNLTTKFRPNERIKLAFIIEGLGNKSIVSIINNGIIERAAARGNTRIIGGEEDAIILGSNNANLSIYSIRCYRKPLSLYKAWVNSAIDDYENIGTRLSINNVLDQSDTSKLDITKVSSKIPTLKMIGDVQSIIDADKKVSTNCDIEFINPEMSHKNFTIDGSRVRKHGQSTMLMPVPSFKFWSDKDESVIRDADNEILPKNRYAYLDTFADGTLCMPMKKWVLQANYMDSSCTYNGSLLRLFDSTWYNANINNKFILRTPPQDYVASTGIYQGHGYKEATGQDFPYHIRTGAYSFPITVFYKKEDETVYKFLGQYIFMDDKKSDYLYGERSIYNNPADPFYFFTTKDKTKLGWDNKNTLQVECLSNVSDHALFHNTNNWDSPATLVDEFDDNYYYQSGDVVWHDVTTEGEKVYYQFNGEHPVGMSWLEVTAQNLVDQLENYDDELDIQVWEKSFELIYPDPDDLKEDGGDAAYYNKANHFRKFAEWLSGTYNNQADFETTAADHLDLNKLAAYYIFLMRFGGVDNIVRNCEFKTYGTDKNGNPTDDDTKWVWWIEPWDWDTLVGGKNNGLLVFEPRITRETEDPSYPSGSGIYAFPGHDSWLWNALESWTYWTNSVVPAVSNALYASGLTYNNVVAMMDNNYGNKYPDLIYNHSLQYKYIDQYKRFNKSESYLSYLKGKGESYRHWWLKTNFDYYDAKWIVGEYASKTCSIRINEATTVPENVHVTYTCVSDCYIALSEQDNTTNKIVQWSKQYDSEDATTIYNLYPRRLSQSNAQTFYGFTNLLSLDFSSVLPYTNMLNIQNVYDSVIGANLKNLNIGVSDEDLLLGKTVNTNVNLSTEEGAWDALETLSMQGTVGLPSINVSYMPNVKNLNLRGCYYRVDNSVYTGVSISLPEGIHYTTLKLPANIQTLSLHDVTWDNIEFWDLTTDNQGTHITQVNYPTNLKSIDIVLTGDNANSACVRTLLETLLIGNGTDLNHLNNLSSVNITGFRWDDNEHGFSLQALKNLGAIRNNINETLQGRVKIIETFTSADYAELSGYFTQEVFSEDNVNGLIIDAVSSVFLAINSEILSGTREYISVAAFPLSKNPVFEIEWRKSNDESLSDPTLPNGVFDSSNHKYYVEPPERDTDYQANLRAVYQGIVSNAVLVTIKKRTYPTSVTVTREDGLNTEYIYQTNSNFIIKATPNVYNKATRGSFEAVIDGIDYTNPNNRWVLEGASSNILSVVGKTFNDQTGVDNLILNIKNVSTTELPITITYRAKYTNGQIFNISKVFKIKLAIPLFTRASNIFLYDALLNDRITTPDNNYYDIDAYSVTSLNSLRDSNISHFEDRVLNNFKNVTNMNFSGMSALGSVSPYDELHIDELTILNSIDVRNTQVSKIHIRTDGLSQLTTVKYSDYSKEVVLIRQPSLTTVSIPEAAVDTLEKLIIENCNNLEEITWN